MTTVTCKFQRSYIVAAANTEMNIKLIAIVVELVVVIIITHILHFSITKLNP